MKSYRALTFWKFGRRFNLPQKKRGFPLWKYDQNCHTKTKPEVRGYVYYEYVYYESWEKEMVAALLYKYKEIRCTCLVWCFRWMELAKELSVAVDEPGSLLLERYFLRNEGWFAISKKNWLFNKALNVHLWSPSWLEYIFFL